MWSAVGGCWSSGQQHVVPATIVVDQAVTLGEAGSWSRGAQESSTMDFSDIVNCRSCELFIDCDSYMWYIMELMMYLTRIWIV